MAAATLGWMGQAAAFVANPVVAPFLLSLGLLGLLEEIRTPSFGMAGTAGLLALALFFGSQVAVGRAGIGDVLLVGAGLVLLGLEMFVLPGFGLVGILGGLGILAGTYLSLLGSRPVAADFVRAGLVLVSAVALTALTAWTLLRSLPPEARPGGRGIFLPHRGGGGTGLASAGHPTGVVGREGSAITDLSPSGTALFGEERVEVVSESEPIPAGTPVRIVGSGGYRLVVRRVGPAGSES
jgi:membrane-bound serine protease (ClpP class)